MQISVPDVGPFQGQVTRQIGDLEKPLTIGMTAGRAAAIVSQPDGRKPHCAAILPDNLDGIAVYRSRHQFSGHANASYNSAITPRAANRSSHW
jgi:hypothetical protein